MRLLLTIAACCVLWTAYPHGHPQNRDLFASGQPAESRRLALVIGNDGYARSPLSNARNDARSVAGALRKLSFDVTLVEDGSRSVIASSMLAFGRRLTKSDLALVFYAGHGAQVDGINYLIPVEFNGRSEDEVRIDGVSSDEVTRALSRARVGVLILDACRDNPFSGQRSGSRGLAQLEAQGLLVAFSTGAGQTASDGGGGNSVFTTELLQVLGSPGRGLRDTFFEVQRRVQASTRGRQFPAVYSQLIDDVVLTPGGVATPPAVDSGTLALRLELELWDAIKGANDASFFEDYLRRYPNGQFRSVAEDRVRRAREASATPSAPPVSTPAVPPASPSSSASGVERITPPSLRYTGALQKNEIRDTVALADRFMAAPSTGSDIGVSFQPFFFRSADEKAFIPFLVTLSRPLLNDAVMYVRVVDRSLRGAKPGSFPWDDINLVSSDTSLSPTRIQRVLMARPGEWDVYVTIAERVGRNAPSTAVSRIGMVRAELSVPDFGNGQLQISTPLVSDRTRTLSAALTPEQARFRPFVFGVQETVPAADMEFRKAESLSVFFQVYNARPDGAGRPDLMIEYEFYRVEDAAPKFFNKTSPQFVNAANLPALFDPAKFPVPGGVEVPLASFADGAFRLTIKITDRANNNRVLTRDIDFSVKG